MLIELCDDIQNLEARIRTAEIEKKELIAANASAEQIADRNFYIASIAAAKKVLVLQDELAREEKHRAKIYHQWYPKAVDLKERVGTARQRHERAAMAYPTSETNVDLIDAAIYEHRASEPRRENFPSPKKIHQWNLRLRHLQEEREKREQNRIAAKTEMESAAADLRKLVDEYQHAANLCRLYGPRDVKAIEAAKPIPVAWTMPSSPASRITQL